MSDTVLIPTSDGVVAYTEQDVEAIIENNKRLQSIPQKSDWGRHVATIPNVFLTQWLNEEHARGNALLRLYSKRDGRLGGKEAEGSGLAFFKDGWTSAKNGLEAIETYLREQAYDREHNNPGGTPRLR